MQEIIIINYFLINVICYGFALTLPQFQSLIPNGALVPSPCNPGVTWSGVGHELADGNGPLNPFKRDFLANGRKYDKTLCQMDSDGDGRTNGEELGDPNCLWVPNSLPTIRNISLLSHPGICEPIDSLRCAGKNDFLKAIEGCPKLQNWWCPAIRQQDVHNLTFQLPDFGFEQTPSYICQQFKVPHDRDYQVIAWEALVANREVVQQINVLICDFTPDHFDLYEKPTKCDAVPEQCYQSPIRWVTGTGKRRCYDDQIGIEMGKKIVLRIRYDCHNISDELLNAAMRIFYTPERRPFDVGTVQVGQMDIAIAPKSRQLTRILGKAFQSSQCSLRTLAPFPSYNLTSVTLRMNELGVHAKLTLKKRNGRFVAIFDEDVVRGIPKVKSWNPAVMLEPGDNIEIECIYKSIDQEQWTFVGFDSGSIIGEICYADFDIFPRPQNRNALVLNNMGKFDICSMNESIIEGCPIMAFRDDIAKWENSTEGGLSTYCNDPELGYPAFSCSYSCYNFLQTKQLLGNPCMKGATFHFAATYYVTSGMVMSKDIYQIRSQAEKCSNLKKPPEISRKDRIIADAIAIAAGRKIIELSPSSAAIFNSSSDYLPLLETDFKNKATTITNQSFFISIIIIASFIITTQLF